MNEVSGVVPFNIGDLAKPVTVLIEKLSSGAGVLFEPTQIKRKAKAEAAAALTIARSQIDINDLNQRALFREQQERMRQQANLERITSDSFEYLKESADASLIDNDWITEFVDRAKRVSNEELQNLWSRILAGESNNPGSISRRTLNFVALLDKFDAELFSKICSFYVPSLGTTLIFGTDDEMTKSQGLSYTDFTNLESLGLIKMASFSPFIKNKVGAKLIFKISNTEFKLVSKNTENINYLKVGMIILTKLGDEIHQFVKSDHPPGFTKYCYDNWKSETNFTINSPHFD